MLSFADLDAPLRELLREFGPSRKSYHSEYPFWRLQTDGIWEVDRTRGAVIREGSSDPLRSELIRLGAHGGLTEDLYRSVTTDSGTLREVVQLLLETSFPATLHEDIAYAVGLSELEAAPKARRDPDFRRRVLTVYERRCVVCGFDVRLGDVLIALEAAHIKWHQAGGPATESNGLALCTMHHKLFDRGAFTVGPERRILVAEEANGSRGLEDWLLAFQGQAIGAPVSDQYAPEESFLNWHRTQVFHGPARV
jgi:putative restriction endonuclease